MLGFKYEIDYRLFLNPFSLEIIDFQIFSLNLCFSSSFVFFPFFLEIGFTFQIVTEGIERGDKFGDGNLI